MIKALFKSKPNDILFLGIDENNLKKLKKGEPILIDGKPFGIDKRILIAYADTLKDLQSAYNIPSVQ